MKRRPALSPKKHNEWQTDFHFQENVSLMIWTFENCEMAELRKRNCAKQSCGIAVKRNFERNGWIGLNLNGWIGLNLKGKIGLNLNVWIGLNLNVWIGLNLNGWIGLNLNGWID